MVHYIRFLKPPRIATKGAKASIKALVTVTTDLGDSFYQAALPIHSILMEEDRILSDWTSYPWRPGIRSLWIEIRDIPIAAVWSSIRLVVSNQKNTIADYASHIDMPEILSAWSEPFGLADEAEVKPGVKLERRFGMNGSVMAIYECCGDNIARHIWDAGVALAAYLGAIAQEMSIDIHSNSILHEILATSRFQGFTVIELGSGCGVVGIQIARIFPKSSVLLTDLAEAMDILEYNSKRAQLAQHSTLKKAILDWDEELPNNVTRGSFDMIVVSDCTYNSDSIPALVNTLAALVTGSPHALVVVSMKVRHDSESIFFTLMSEVGLVQVDHSTVPLPSRQMENTVKGAIEFIDIYMYCKAQV